MRPGLCLAAMLALAACGAPDRPAAAPPAPASATAKAPPPVAAAPPVGEDVGAGPDDNETLIPPSAFHGTWRIVAEGDRADAALMTISIQHGVGEREASADFVLFQPFCDAVAGVPITGTSDCELIGLSGPFESARVEKGRMVLIFRPTADGVAHRLVLVRDGGGLAGRYRNPDVNLRLKIEPAPGDTQP